MDYLFQEMIAQQEETNTNLQNVMINQETIIEKQEREIQGLVGIIVIIALIMVYRFIERCLKA